MTGEVSGGRSLCLDWEESIAAPPERVFAAFTNPRRMGEWMPGFTGIDQRPLPPPNPHTLIVGHKL